MGYRQPYLGSQTALRVPHLGSTVVRMDSTAYAAAVAANIREAISAAGVSVLNVAQSTDIPYTTLDRRLRSGGASPFSVREVRAIAQALGTTAAKLTTVYVDAAEAVPA